MLSLPLSRTELLLGKWLAVVSITGVGVTLQIGGLLFGIAYLASDFIDVPSLSIGAVLLLALAIGFYGTMIVALYLALAMRSKSVKEAGSVLTPITLAMIMPILLTQFINLDDVEMFWFGVPFVNVLLFSMWEFLFWLQDLYLMQKLLVHFHPHMVFLGRKRSVVIMVIHLYP